VNEWHVFHVGENVAVKWMGEIVLATIERIEEERQARSYWLAIPGVEYLAAYRERELAQLPESNWCERP
jgi:hypothetical protein